MSLVQVFGLELLMHLEDVEKAKEKGEMPRLFGLASGLFEPSSLYPDRFKAPNEGDRNDFNPENELDFSLAEKGEFDQAEFDAVMAAIAKQGTAVYEEDWEEGPDDPEEAELPEPLEREEWA